MTTKQRIDEYFAGKEDQLVQAVSRLVRIRGVKLRPGQVYTRFQKNR